MHAPADPRNVAGLGLISAMTARQSFGRYIVQASGTASRIELERLHEVINSARRCASWC